jgi:tetratricopeptide (TPR) repeat protein
MSRVFAVRDNALHREIVVKVLPPELAGELSTERFKREIQFAASLQHPHIVPVHAAGDADGLPYYTMPRVEGESLRDRLARTQRLAVGEALTILRDIARALAYAHKRGIVHRDIKPENVLVHDGVAVVTDFGIAKAIAAAREDERDSNSPATVSEGTNLTMTGTSLGTPSYMAPEQAAADPRMDHRVDLYALGVVGYELLAGRTPFSGRTPREQLTAQLAERPRELMEMRLDIPPAVAGLLMRAMEKDPEARPETADEMVRELDAALTGAPVTISAEEPANIRRAFALYVGAFVAATGLSWVAMRQIGLPDWVFPGTIAVMALGLPVLVFTAISRYAAFQAALGTSVQRSGSLVWQNPFGDRGLRAAQYLSWRRVATGGVFALGGFGVLVAGFMASRASGIGPAASLLSKGQIVTHQRVLVTDFGAAFPDSALARLAGEAVRVGLDQSNVVTVMTPGDVTDALRRMRRDPGERLTLPLARELASRAGVGVIVDGDLLRSGGRLLLTVRLVAADAGRTLVARSAGADTPDQLVQAADRVTRALRTSIGESFKQVRASPPLEQVTTASREAFELFTRARRVWLVDGRPLDAVAPLKRAVEIDTLFASAWRALAVLLNNNGMEPQLANHAFTRAFELRDRASENERLIIEGTYLPGRDINRAIDAYERWSERTGLPNTNLAILLNSRRRYAAAESIYARVTSSKDLNLDSYPDYINSLMMQGKVREADSVARDGRARFPGDVRPRLWHAEMTCVRLLLEACDAALDSLTTTGAPPRFRQRIFTVRALMSELRGQLARGRQLRLEGMVQGGNVPRFPRPGFFGDVDRDIWYYRRPDRAVARLDSVADSLKDAQLAQAAGLYGMAGRPVQGRQALARWHQEKPDSLRRDNELWNLNATRGWIEEAEGDWTAAIASWRAFDVLKADGRPIGNCVTCLAQALARMYEATSRPDSAIYWYEKTLATPSNSVGGFTAIVWDIYERLGTLYEAVGNRAKAIEYSTRFAELWKNADPELQPRVANARARIARLSPG